jgi:hypothetical protein
MNVPYLPEILLMCALAVLVGMPYLFYVRWYVPRRQGLAMQKARITIERLRREEAAGIPPNPADYHYAISFDSERLTVTDLRSQKHGATVIFWSDIRHATAFKRDLFNIDCICLHLVCADGTGVELNEEMAGWSRLMDALQTYLPGCKPHSDWYATVAFPAFAPNPTEIYLRASEERKPA